MTTCLIKTISGQVNLPKMSAKIHLFHSPRSGGSGNMEVFLDKAATTGLTSSVIQRNGFPRFTPSIPGMRAEIVGNRVEQSFNVAEGEILKVFVNVRRGWGHLPRNGSVFVRVRKDAAYRKLRFKTIDHAEIDFTHGEIEGSFDVLSLEDVRALGVVVPRGLSAFAEAHNVQQILSENIVIIPEASAPVRYEQKVLVDEATGAKRSMIVRRKRRAIE